MKRQLGIGIILILLTLCCPAFGQEGDKPVVAADSVNLGEVNDAFQEHFFEALKQKAIENYGRAIDELVQCLVLDPKPVVYLELGKNYNALEKYSEAATYLERGRAVVPENVPILEELYKAYYLDNDWERSLAVVKRLSKMKPSFSEDLANLYLLNEKFDLALSLLDSLDATRGPSTYRDSVRRELYARTNNVEAQIADLKERITEQPGDERNYLNLIFVYSENGRPDAAFEAAKQLLEKNPSSELVHLALYKFYLDAQAAEKAVNSLRIVLGSGQIDETTKYQALNDFLMYVSNDPQLEDDLIDLAAVFSDKENNYKVYTQLGNFFLEKRKKETALKYFELALEAVSADYQLFKEVLDLRYEFGDYREVLSLSERAIEIFPSQPYLYLIRGKAQTEVQEFENAEKSLILGLSFLIEDPVMETAFYRALASTYKGMGASEKATEFLKKAEKLEMKK